MKRTLIIIALLALLALLAPAALWAQEELTLEVLAETVAALAERVEIIEGRHQTTKIDSFCKLPNDINALDPEAATKWEALTGEEALTSFRRGLEFSAESETVTFYFEERHNRDSYGIFVSYDKDCNASVGEWTLIE